MAYGHAERTLEAIRMLVAETRELLSEEPDLDAEQKQWLCEEDDVSAKPASCRYGNGGPIPSAARFTSERRSQALHPVPGQERVRTLGGREDVPLPFRSVEVVGELVRDGGVLRHRAEQL
jgi:hypothetical protein